MERWQHSEGDLGEVEVRDTEIIVQLGSRLHVRRRGDGRLQQCDAVPGAVWLCPAGVREDMIHLYGEVEESLHLFFPASPLSATALRELDVDPDRLDLHYEGGFRDPLVQQIAMAVRAEMMDSAPAGKVLVETLAAALRVHILRHYSNLEPAAIALPRVRGALDARRLKRVTEFIETHLGADLSIEALAEQAHLSPFHFARAFKVGDRGRAAPVPDRTPHRARKGVVGGRPAPPRRHCPGLRLLVPGPPHALVQAYRGHDAGCLPGGLACHAAHPCAAGSRGAGFRR